VLYHKAYFESFTQRDLQEFLSGYRDALTELKNDGPSPHAYCAIGRLSAGFHLYYQAIDNYKKAIAADPSYEKAYTDLARLYQDMGLHYSQIEILRQMVALSPGNEGAARVLGVLTGSVPRRTVTFYVPCYNVEKYICQAIEGILAQSYRADEILVIDDGCTDRTMELAAAYPVRLVRHKENRGLAAARNTALENASGEFIASVDTDAVPDTFWLERILLAFNDDAIAGVGGMLIEANAVTVVDRWRQVRMPQHYGQQVRDKVCLFGSNAVFRTAALKAVGGYHESLRTNAEDVYISKTLMAQDFRTRYIPGAVCRHLRTDTLLSAVTTCHNWRKPYFEAKGAFQDISLLRDKGVTDMETITGDFFRLIEDKQYHLLYPELLNCVRTVLRDLYLFHNSNPSPMTLNTFKCAYIVTIYLLVRTLSQKSTPGNKNKLAQYIIGDTADLASLLNIQGDKDFASAAYEAVTDTIEKQADINAVLATFGANSLVYMDYISEVFSRFSNIFTCSPIIFPMLETGARRIRYEAGHPAGNAQGRVMLLNPPWRVGNRTGVRAGSRWPFTSEHSSSESWYTPYPFFLGYLSSLLKQMGTSAVIVDAVAEELSEAEFIERVAGYAPSVILMEVATASFVVDSLWVLRIKERLSGVKIIWTGTHATALGESIIRENPMVDFIIQGEYERAASELIDALLAGRDYRNITGLLFLDADGDLVNNGRANTIDLDSLPLPERLTVPLYKYNDLFAGMEYPSLQLHASRGCPFGCIFCVWPQILYGNNKYRTRSPQKVVDEIETCVRDFGFRSFYFDDDTFNIGRERILTICEELQKRGLRIPWGAMARADTADFESLSAMKNAGLVGIKFGVESGVQELVDRAGKGLRLDKVVDAVRWCRELGIMVHLTFTFGLPGETPDTIDKTIAFAKKMNPDTIQFSITTPFPGTKYFDMLKQSGNILTEEWDRYDGGLNTVISSGSLGREYLQEAVARANREFYEFKARLPCT
jgi:radical SAM superfamily enzyme YgiQ (UPF0313 family)/glycosyltransferase involved in cell wall biosynthesis